jgi:predicted ATPase
VLLFNGLDNIESNFSHFYEAISKEAILKHGRIHWFTAKESGKCIVKSNNLRKKDDELIRNNISHELIPILTQVFEDMYNVDSMREKKILEECYTKNEDIKKYTSELGFIFSDNPPTFDTRISAVQNTDRTHSQIKNNIEDQYLPDPIIIIGGKGAGKTTFINILFKLY